MRVYIFFRQLNLYNSAEYFLFQCSGVIRPNGKDIAIAIASKFKETTIMDTDHRLRIID